MTQRCETCGHTYDDLVSLTFCPHQRFIADEDAERKIAALAIGAVGDVGIAVSCPCGQQSSSSALSRFVQCPSCHRTWEVSMKFMLLPLSDAEAQKCAPITRLQPDQLAS